jgi:hypothetical protein
MLAPVLLVLVGFLVWICPSSLFHESVDYSDHRFSQSTIKVHSDLWNINRSIPKNEFAVSVWVVGR